VNQAPIYDWHKRHLQTLQWVAESPTTRWVVKAPSHLSHLPLLFATYPDARVVMMHRDPLRVVGSLSDLLATLHHMHSDHVDYDVLVEFVAMGHEMQMNHIVDERDGGAIPVGQIADVVYKDLIRDPTTVIERLYAGWDLPVTPEFRATLESYLAARHHEHTSGHDYSFADTGLDLTTHRALVAPYQGRFGVPSEV
jgi:hypothetical protein